MNAPGEDRAGFERLLKGRHRKECPQVRGREWAPGRRETCESGVARLPGTGSPSEPILYLAHLSFKLPFYILPLMLKLELCKLPFPDSFVTWPPCHVLPKEGSEADWKMEGGKKIFLVFLGGGGFSSAWLQQQQLASAAIFFLCNQNKPHHFRDTSSRKVGPPTQRSENQSHRSRPALLDSGNPQIPFICLVFQVAMASCVSISGYSVIPVCSFRFSSLV